MDLTKALQKIADVFEKEEVSYMIVGGFATSYYNRYRFTSDIDCVVGMYPHNIEKIVKHFPDWMSFLPAFKENAERGIVFNLTDFDTGVKYDFMLYQDSDYSWTAFERRKKVTFSGIDCYIATAEDLIISKLQWYNVSESGKQLEDIQFLLKLKNIDFQYLKLWTSKLYIKTHGLLGKRKS